MPLNIKPFVETDQIVNRIFSGKPSIYADVDINQLNEIQLKAFERLSGNIGTYSENFNPAVVGFSWTGANVSLSLSTSVAGKLYMNKTVFNIPVFNLTSATLTPPAGPYNSAWQIAVNQWYKDSIFRVFLIATKSTVNFASSNSVAGVFGPGLVSPLPSSDAVKYSGERVAMVAGQNVLPSLSAGEEIITVLFSTCWLQDETKTLAFPTGYRYDIGYLNLVPDKTLADIWNTPTDFMPRTEGVVSFLQKFILSSSNQLDTLKERIRAFELLWDEDADTIINNLKNFVDAFNGMPEGVGAIVTALNGKIDLDAGNLSAGQKTTLRTNLSIYSKAEVDSLLTGKVNLTGLSYTTLEKSTFRTNMGIYGTTEVDTLLDDKANRNGSNINGAHPSNIVNEAWLNSLGVRGTIVHAGSFKLGRLGFSQAIGSSQTSHGVTWTRVADTRPSGMQEKYITTSNGHNVDQYLWAGGSWWWTPIGGTGSTQFSPSSNTRCILRVYCGAITPSMNETLIGFSSASTQKLKRAAFIVCTNTKDEPNMWWVRGPGGVQSQFGWFSGNSMNRPLRVDVHDVFNGSNWNQDLFYLDISSVDFTPLSDITREPVYVPGTTDIPGREYEVQYFFYY